MKRYLVLGFLFSALTAAAAERQIAFFEDAAGDDNGDGTLVYPRRADFQPGDLDLLSLRLIRTDNTYRFEATFKNPIRSPATVAGDVGPESLSYFARRGFYEFNLDVYIDQDRIKESGNTYTLPGRGVSIDGAHAWEKAVILTPRPELMRQQYIDALAESEGARNRDEIANRIDNSIVFATDVQVRNRTVSFSVPAAFLGGGVPETHWSLTAMVTGAKTSAEADFNLSHSSGTSLERLTLGAMQPEPGRPRDTLGYSGVVAPAPVVDLLAPAASKQAALLAPSVPAENKAPAHPSAAPSPATNDRSTAARLRALQQLLDQGLITQAEYAELRRKILSEL